MVKPFLRASAFVALAFALSTALACSACGSKKKDGTPEPVRGNGVNDLKQSCEIRATWTHKGTPRCADCLSSSQGPSCGCEQFKEFSGTCLVQDRAKRSEPTCTADMDLCAKKCPANDCTCFTNCYAASEACRVKAAAREGCMTEVCSPFCK